MCGFAIDLVREGESEGSGCECALCECDAVCGRNCECEALFRFTTRRSSKIATVTVPSASHVFPLVKGAGRGGLTRVTPQSR